MTELRLPKRELDVMRDLWQAGEPPRQRFASVSEKDLVRMRELLRSRSKKR
jgi:hypothetical protein